MAYSPRKEVPLLVETTHILPHVIDEVEAPQCCKSTQYEEGHEEIYGLLEAVVKSQRAIIDKVVQLQSQAIDIKAQIIDIRDLLSQMLEEGAKQHQKNINFHALMAKRQMEFQACIESSKQRRREAREKFDEQTKFWDQVIARNRQYSLSTNGNTTKRQRVNS